MPDTPLEAEKAADYSCGGAAVEGIPEGGVTQIEDRRNYMEFRHYTVIEHTIDCSPDEAAAKSGICVAGSPGLRCTPSGLRNST
jgi:hypothetical protein